MAFVVTGGVTALVASGIEVFAIKQYDNKFGTQWDNFLLGIQFSATLLLVTLVVYLTLTAIFIKQFQSKGVVAHLVSGSILAGATVLFLFTGVTFRIAAFMPAEAAYNYALASSLFAVAAVVTELLTLGTIQGQDGGYA